MKCIDCGADIGRKAACGLVVCDGCCAVCYRQDEPCEDMAKIDYIDTRNRAIIAERRKGMTAAALAKKYGVGVRMIFKMMAAKSRPVAKKKP